MKKSDHIMVQRVLDGDMKQEEFAAFQQRLRDDPEMLKMYGDYALLHHTLHEEFEGGHSHYSTSKDGGRRLLGLPFLAICIGLLVILAALYYGLMHWQSAEDWDEVAVVAFSVDAVWQIDGASRNLGSATAVAQGSSMHLGQGRASISLEPAVKAVIEGPADVIMVSKHKLHLTRGRGYFRRSGTGGGLTVTTPRLVAEDSGAEFCIEAPDHGPDELFVREGSVKVMPKGGDASDSVEAGNGVRVLSDESIVRIPADNRHFATGLGRFRTVLTGPFQKTDWRIEYGNPTIAEHRIEGANYTAFLRLPGSLPESENSVLLAALTVRKPTEGEFHTDGWAGLSFFHQGNEVMFFGDSFGTKATWSLDVKQHIPVIVPEQSITGAKTVTLRYDVRTGAVSLHEGGVPLKVPFCVGSLIPGTRFDEIRIGASAGASLVVDSLDLRVGGD